MKLWKAIEKFLYEVRDSLWDYPQVIFANEKSFYRDLRAAYISTRPFSHVAVYLVVVGIIFLIVSSNVSAFLRINTTTLIEGVIVGVDETGNLQKLNRVNPLTNTNVQLEKDLIELIYQGLITVDQSGELSPGLADFLELEPGKLYRFKLKDDLFWSDGEPLTTEDVEATFDLLTQLDTNPATSTLFSRAATKIDVKVIDEHSFEFQLNSAIPAFFEAISFKILPKHLMYDLSPVNINSADPLINRNPIGSGPYALTSVGDDSIVLTQNEFYQGEKSQIKNIKFKLFTDEDTAVDALMSGQIHSLTGISSDRQRSLQDLKQIDVIGSNVIYNQYWALYFNLAKNGPEVFKESKVRRAISSAINRELILETLLGYGEEAVGPIPVSSFAYARVRNYRFNKERAEKLLDEAGWEREGGVGMRTKDGIPLGFQLLLVDNVDRVKIAELIKKDLEDVGIAVEVVTKNRSNLVNEHIVPRVFETVLYGVQTFIDPDRFELFHSSQIEHPGLNIASYRSVEKILTVREGKTVRIPKVDDALDDGRKLLDEDKRAEKYEVFQELVANDVPAVFLFHPVETYAVNKRIKGIELGAVNSIEQRFNEIENWRLDVK
ncbi:MAG: peptide ABC transporter substrate-binding protein [Candidatus Dojkabacteria bacterium]